jgi:Zn-dependent peptidase ImmA (M78 family)
MTTTQITGKPTKLSTEEVRTIIHATKSVLEFHNLTPARKTVHVYIVPLNHKELGNNMGATFYPKSQIWLNNNLKFDEMLTTVIHEMIHTYHPRCGLDDEAEHQTSTLTARLKPTIAKLYGILSDGIYQRAGYIAHVKMSYKPKECDTYNTNEDIPIKVKNKAKKYRNKRKPFKPNKRLVG